MNVRTTLLLLISASFVFDSFALGLVKADGPLIATLQGSNAILSYTLPLLQSVTFPMLVLVYAGSIFDVLLVGRLTNYLRGRRASSTRAAV